MLRLVAEFRGNRLTDDIRQLHSGFNGTLRACTGYKVRNAAAEALLAVLPEHAASSSGA